MISQLGADLATSGDPIEHFITSVQSTLLLSRPRQFLVRHEGWFNEWQRDELEETPPMVGLLSLFSYAATLMKNDRDYFSPLAELLGVSDAHSLGDCYNRHVRYYWHALNKWVEQVGRGTPTAYPKDMRANVSLLLTQRFLSAAERAQLPEYFSKTGLAPGTSMPLSEMEDLLRRTRQVIPPALRDEYARHQSRFAEVAVIELENWDGSVADEDDVINSRLLLGAYFDRRAATVEFPLAVAGGRVPPGEFFFEGATTDSPAVAEAVAVLGGRVTFDEGDGIRFARGPRLSSFGIAQLLGEDVSLSSSQGFKLTRGMSEIVLLLPISANSYIEAPGRRAPLGSRFTLLVTARVANDSEFQEMIGGVAATSLPGVPAGWAVFRDLELSSVPAGPSGLFRKLLQLLLPSQQAASIDIRGGIPLAGPTRSGRAWLSCDPPDLVVSASVTPIEVILHMRPVDGAATDEQLVSDGGRGYRRSAGSIPTGDHQLFVTSDGKALSQRKLRLVSSDTPRLPSIVLGHVLTDTPWAVLSAQPAAADSVRGASWEPMGARLRRVPVQLLPAWLDRLPVDMSDTSGERLRLDYTRDIRPDVHQRRRKRPRSMTQIGSAQSVFTMYETTFQDAVAEARDEVATSDGRRWKLRYHENDEVSVQPKEGFVPMTRYRIVY